MRTENPQFPNEMQTIRDFQAFHQWLDEKNNFDTDIFFNMMLLTGEIGEVAQVLKQVHFMAYRNDEEAKTLEDALIEQRENLGQELADCLAYIFKLANYTGVDLQAAYLQKMSKNLHRTWKYVKEVE
ncbi:MAG: MazG-like family protein [Chloroflexi bacterium]|nr:MazG-like family protein [Chloroflexota bacterium]